MTLEAIEVRLKHLVAAVAHHALDPAQLGSHVPLSGEGLALDSVALLELVVRIETEFGITLEDGALALEHVASVRTLAETIQGQLAAQRAS